MFQEKNHHIRIQKNKKGSRPHVPLRTQFMKHVVFGAYITRRQTTDAIRPVPDIPVVHVRQPPGPVTADAARVAGRLRRLEPRRRCKVQVRIRSGVA